MDVSYEANVLALNKQAMDDLRQGQHEKAFELLNEAEKLIKAHDLDCQMWAVTMNNYGCYYKKIGKLQEALSCLNLAMNKEKFVKGDAVNKAATHLNVSSIFSSLDIHETALEHAQKALKILKRSGDKSVNTVTTLVVAFHTVGIELEALFRQLEAMRMYKEGWELARNALNEGHPLTAKLKKHLSSVSSCLEPVKALRSSKPASCAEVHPISRISHPSKSRLTCRKAPSSIQYRETFPLISNDRTGNSFSQSRKNRKTLKSQEKNFPLQHLSTLPRRPLKMQVIDSKKIENLRNLIEEIEAESSIHPKNIIIKEKVKKIQEVKSSIGVQVDPPVEPLAKKIENERKIRTSHRNRNYQRAAITNSELHLADLKVKEAIREVQNLQKLKEMTEMNEKKELVPVFKSSKVELFKSNKLSTIYESKYEDQRESLVMIQSWIRTFLARRKYLKILESVKTIQKQVKTWQTRKLFKKIKNAAVFIQSFFRGHRVRKLYNFLLTN
jgi:tetratricopeptide (TPR) repeat protein